jgi:hypothetical protein
VEQTQELLQKWDDRARRLHPRMEISREGLMLGTGTVLAGMAKDERGRPRLALDDERRALALLATAYDRPVDVRLLAKLRRAAELWNDGEKALAHIHFGHARLPPCGPDQALRLFVADELIEAGVTPETLMKAQGFDPAPLDLLKFNPDQPRVPAGSGRESGEGTSGEAGNGRESGESTSDDANITPVAFREKKGRRRRGGGFDLIHDLLELLRGRSQEKAKSAVKPFGSLESDLLQPGYGEEVSIPGLPDDIKGIDTTDRGAGTANYDTYLSRSEFESELSRLGWAKEQSADGKVMIYTKDGAKYIVGDDAKSTGEPTADFYHPRGDGESIDMKLRLRKD